MRHQAALILVTPLLCAASWAQAPNPALDSFRQAALLRRFDHDADGRLSERERSMLRDAYGGIDVPMLPARPYDYTLVRLPSCVDPAELERADNTVDENPLTNDGATLGRVLFYDKQLSRNNTVACASCHHQRAAFSDPRQFSVGFDGRHTSRNAMGLANVRFTNLKGMRPGFFWDERAATLEAQVLMPIQDPLEMGMDLRELEAKLQKLPYYPPLFDAAFGSPEVSSQRIARAVAQFMRSMLAFDSKFDRAASRQHVPTTVPGHAHHNYSAPFDDFTAQENLGKSLFMDGAGGIVEHGCAVCHMPPSFAMPKAFNNGLDLKYRDQGLGALGRPSNAPFTPSNDGKFKAPALRNIELTAPYMHDGRFTSLEEVIEHYSGGVHPHENLGLAFDERGPGDAPNHDSGTLGFKFTAEQKTALVVFLKTLTDHNFVADLKFSDPFVRSSAETHDGNEAERDSPAEQFERLLKEHEEGAEPRQLAARFLELAEQHATDPVAVDALVWVLTKLRSRPEAIRALELLQTTQLDSEKLASACAAIARTPATRAELLLEAAVQKSPHKEVRAQALLHWAALLDQQAAVVEQLKKHPESAARLLQYYSKDYGKHLAALDREKLDKKREQVYERLLQSFPDMPTRDGTIRELAERALFQIRHLSIGRVAPEIDGEDISGTRFKLSEYRGKVVVLSFWGHW